MPYMYVRYTRAVSWYFGNGARAFEIGKNSVVLDRIGKFFNKSKKSVLSFALRDISGKWPIKSKKHGPGYGGRLRPTLGPGQRPGRGFRGGKPPEKIWVFKHFKSNFLLNSDTYKMYFSPKKYTQKNTGNFFFS